MTLSKQEFADAKELPSPQVSQAKSIIRQLVSQLGVERFELWFGAPDCLRVVNHVVEIHAASQFAIQNLKNRFDSVIRQTVARVCGTQFQVAYEVSTTVGHSDVQANEDENDQPSADGQTLEENGSPAIHSTPVRHDTDQVFNRIKKRRPPQLDAFEFGEENGLAKAGVDQVLKHIGQISPFYLFGPSGCGKSHLLECLTNEVRRRHHCRAVYLTAEQFTSYFVQSIRGSGLPMFRRKYRDLDLLAIDDIQFFEGKKATLSEVQHTIDNLIYSGKQVVVSADRPPIELDRINADLATRLTSGLTCPLHFPGDEQRLNIARKFCKRRQISIPESVLELICQRISKDVRKLSGAINLLNAARIATGGRITVELAEQVLSDMYTISGAGTSMGEIEKVVCDFCGVKSVEIKSPSRKKKVCTARMLAMYLSREYTSSAFSEIGDYFGGRSHSTVIAAQHKVNGWIKDNQNIDLPRAKYPAKEVLRRIESKLRIG